MSKYGYRNIWYNPRRKQIHLWTWDEDGNRIERTDTFNPYLYIESNSKADGLSIYNTNLRKIVFPSQFERRKYTNESGIKRLFFNLKPEQQYLLDNCLILNEQLDFTKNPLKIFSLDIETETYKHPNEKIVKVREGQSTTELTLGEFRKTTDKDRFEVWDEQKQQWVKYSISCYYTEHVFPDIQKASHPINLITYHDSLTDKFHTFGTKPYNPKDDNIIYHQCSTEVGMLQKFIEEWSSDYPDIMTGWNCVSHTECVWMNDRIQNISKISKNNKLFMSDHINNYMNTGKKKESVLTTEIGTELKCSSDHIIPVYLKDKHKYKNKNTLIKQALDLSVDDISKKIEKEDVYVKVFFNKNTLLDYTYRQFLIDFLEVLPDINFYITDTKIRDRLKNVVGVEQYIPIKDYWWGKKFWEGRRCWSYTHLKDILTKDEILEYLHNTTELILIRDSKYDTALLLDQVISTDILQLLGFIFTDGSLDKKTQHIRYSNKHRNIIEQYTTIYNNETESALCLSSPQQKDNCYYKEITTNNIIGMLLPIIYDNGYNKNLNIEIISRLSSNQFYSLLAGMIDGDGWISSNAVNMCHFDQPHTLKTIQQLLLWNNTFSYKYTNNNTISIPKIPKNIEFLNFCASKMFHDDRKTRLINLPQNNRKQSASNNIRYYIYDTFAAVRVKDVQHTDNIVQMFDIETSTHYFVCNGIKVHNCEFFDIPYIINRITNLLGIDYTNRLSPVSSLFYKEDIKQQYGKTQGKWIINGVSCVDYKDAYETFSRSELESYKLDYVAKVELNEGKTEYNSTNLGKLSDTDWNKFVEYNIQDVRLLVKLENKLRFLKIMRTIAYKGFTSIEATMGKVMVVTGVIAAQALKHNKIISTFIHDNIGEYAGGFVKDINPSLANGVVTFDANSLYPNTLITLNLSQETKIGKILNVDTDKNQVEIKLVNGKIHTLNSEAFRDFLGCEKISISKAKVLFSQKQKGIIPEYVDSLYKERVDIKNKMDQIERSLAHCKKESEKWKENKLLTEQLDLQQYTIKILLNSIYGVFANRHSPFADVDLASSITLTGQAVIKQASDILDKYAQDKFNIVDPIVIYNDTDSTHLTLKPILTKKNISLLNDKGEINSPVYDIVVDMNTYLNEQINEWAKTSLHSIDPRFYFKREAICAAGIYQSKKHYILHIKDKGESKPLPCDKIKYVGVEVAKSTMSSTVKDLIKDVIKTMLYTGNEQESTKKYRDAYEKFKKLPPEEIAFRSNINKYELYEAKSQGYAAAKRTPVHVKAALYYNKLLTELNIQNNYEAIASGNKMKWLYCNPNNKLNIEEIAFTATLPKEFEFIVPDYDKMFEKIVMPAIKRLYECTKWNLVDIRNEYSCNLLDLFSE